MGWKDVDWINLAQDSVVWWAVVEKVMNPLVYNSNYMHKSQGLFYLTTALHVSGVTISQLQENEQL